jgi:hypothetical protein
VHYSTGDALLTGTEGKRWSVARDTFDFSVVSGPVFAQSYELLD